MLQSFLCFQRIYEAAFITLGAGTHQIILVSKIHKINSFLMLFKFEFLCHCVSGGDFTVVFVDWPDSYCFVISSGGYKISFVV